MHARKRGYAGAGGGERQFAARSGRGCGVAPGDSSAKGLKGGASVTLNGGVYSLDCSDDAIHSNGSVSVLDGSYTISTGDDGIHADEEAVVSDGSIEIVECYEGIEGAVVEMPDGEMPEMPEGGFPGMQATSRGENPPEKPGAGGKQ